MMPKLERGVRPRPASDLPACFQGFSGGERLDIAEEIYRTLLSLENLAPVQTAPSNAVTLNQRQVRYVIEGVMTGRRFKALELHETSNVEFVGVAAGVLEAVRLGAVDEMVAGLFFSRVRQLADTLSDPRIASLHRQSARSSLYSRAGNWLTARKGKLSIEKVHSVHFLVDRTNDISTVWALRIIDIPHHPQKYGDPYVGKR